MGQFPIPKGADPCGGFIGYEYQIPEFYFPTPPPSVVWFFYYKPSGFKIVRSTNLENSLLTATPMVDEDGALFFDIDTGEVLFEIL